MNGHTPGPWALKLTNKSVFQSRILRLDSKVIALIPSGDFSDEVPLEESAANASLIAAAPQMKAAVEAIIESAGAADFPDAFGVAVKLARLALRAAEGGEA